MIAWTDLGAALALVLVIEGLLPLVAPRSFRQAMLAAAQMDDRLLRVIGLVTMIGGVILLYWIR